MTVNATRSWVQYPGPHVNPSDSDPLHFDLRQDVGTGADIPFAKTGDFQIKRTSTTNLVESLIEGLDYTIFVGTPSQVRFTNDSLREQSQALVAGERLTALRILSLTQSGAAAEPSNWTPLAVEKVWDKATQRAQQQQEEIERGLRVAVGSATLPSTIDPSLLMKRPVLLKEVDQPIGASILEIAFGDERAAWINDHDLLGVRMKDIRNVTPNSAIRIQFSNTDGATYLTSGFAGGVTRQFSETKGEVFRTTSSGVTEITSSDMDNAFGFYMNWIANPGITGDWWAMRGGGTYRDGADDEPVDFQHAAGIFNLTSPVNAFKLFPDAGLITGNIKIWGLPKT